MDILAKLNLRRTVHRMKKNIDLSGIQSPALKKDSRDGVHDHSHFALISEDNGVLNQDLSTSQVIRSLFEGTLKPSNTGLKIQIIDNQQDTNLKECSLSIRPTESESVLTVCNPEDIREGAAEVANSAQIITNSEGLSC